MRDLIDSQPECEDSPMPRERGTNRGLNLSVLKQQSFKGLEALAIEPEQVFEDKTRDRNNLLLLRTRKPIYR